MRFSFAEILMVVCTSFVATSIEIEAEREVIAGRNNGILSVTITHRMSSNMTSSILCVNVPVSIG